MSKGSMAEMLNRAMPFMAVTFMQFGYAGMSIISKFALNHGMSPHVLVVYRHAVATVFIAPFAVVFDRKVRPKMTLSIFIKIVLLGLLEPVIDQNLFYTGMKLTTATFASAMCNVLPAFAFIMAWIFRLEKINLRSLHSLAKILGTIVTVGGAMLMTLINGPMLNFPWTRRNIHQESTVSTVHQDPIKGAIMIAAGCFCWAGFMILQGIICSGIAYYIQGVVMKERGPVFVTAFSPLSMIIVAIMSSLILAEIMYLGRVIGAMVIVIGLYMVLWGKSKDQLPSESEKDDNMELATNV
ncbi:WAT1-related protein At2g39510-like isoform X2 [Malus domestica]|uniref:WAT1-related protein At2g39510-like isoform X2 n=1 Tax=Malus domestica TaxID=3750 RepID=UPI0039749EC9